MASRASSASEGEIFEKAKTINQQGESSINGADRPPLGLDGASDYYGNIACESLIRFRGLTRTARNYRNSNRSPSPYRRKRTRSRSPSPYRHNRASDRSPSPYRHSRGNRGYGGNDSRFHNKRKASPPRGGRGDKRHHTDRSRHGDRDHRPWSRADDALVTSSHKEQMNAKDRQGPKPISYAEIENPNAVPNFSDGLSADRLPQQHSGGERKRESNGSQYQSNKQAEVSTPTPSENVDIEMKSTQDEPEYNLTPAEDKAPTQESREEKQRRWAAIRRAAEEKVKKENLLQQALLSNASESTTPNAPSPATHLESSVSPAASPRIGHLDSAPASPDVMIIDKEQIATSAGDSPSAADYDPTKDMLDDRDRAALKAQQSDLASDAYKETDPKVLSTLPAEKVAPVKKQKKEFDMFASDDEDEDEVEEEDNTAVKGTVLDAKMLDNWDDKDGYYKIHNNESVNADRYRIIKSIGRGVFANVAQAEDNTADGNDKKPRLVAIKMIRKNDLMRKASLKEMEFLRRVNEADPQDKHHIIRLLSSFDHKGHLCIVFEHMSKNLRDLLKEETSGHGLALQAVRSYARQMFSALRHLQSCQIIHLDLKPDNILVSLDKKTIKLCDFGTAEDKRDNIEWTGYLVSRFYRAPEIILGMEIGYGVDMWAIGCTIYELWTGKILFTGRSNNQMIKAFMDCLGWPSEKLLKKGLLAPVLEHFEAGPPLKFISREVDDYGKPFVRKIQQQKKINKDLKTRVHDAAKGIAHGGPSTTELNDFAELLGATLNLNVEKRIQPKEALIHKFLVNKPLMPRPTVMKPTMLKRGTPGIRR